MGRVCRIVLVCEGWEDSRFARAFLNAGDRKGINIQRQENPGGSGHDWVKNQFVQQVATLRLATEGCGVLGLLDEDGRGATAREQEVNSLLRQRGLPELQAGAGRCLLLPTRNLETWIYWLRAQERGMRVEMNETTDYKRAGPPEGLPRMGGDDCRLAGEYLDRLNHVHLPEGCPLILGKALGHLRAFLDAVRR